MAGAETVSRCAFAGEHGRIRPVTPAADGRTCSSCTSNTTRGTDRYPIGRVDLVYEEFKVILEYEGDQHRTDRRQWNVDIDRTDEFTAEGYRVIRITAQRMQRPRHMVGKVFVELRRRGYTGPEPVISTEWSQLFEPGA